MIETVLRLADDSTVPIVIRPIAGSDEYEAVTINGRDPRDWNIAMMPRLTGTRRATIEQEWTYRARRDHAA